MCPPPKKRIKTPLKRANEFRLGGVGREVWTLTWIYKYQDYDYIHLIPARGGGCLVEHRHVQLGVS